jgi:hypothetical protein
MVKTAPQVANAVELCPMYLYGIWNGVYYYYCTESGNCGNNPQSGQSTVPKQCGCNGVNCADPNPIQPRILQSKAPDDREKKLKDYVKPKKNGGQAGEGADEASTFLIQHEGVSHLKGSDEKVLEVDAQGGKRYFRTLRLEIPDPKKENPKGNYIEVRIGQELSGKPTGEVVPAVIVTSASETGEYYHELKTSDSDKPYKVICKEKMKKP